MKRVLLISLVLILVFAGNTAAQTVGEAAPDFTVDLLGGGKFTLSEESGKVVLIFFLGNECPYCITSGPNVEALYETYKDNQEFVAVGLDTWGNSTESTLTDFRSKSGVMFPLAYTAKDNVVTAYATTFDRLAVIDKGGVLRFNESSKTAGNAAENASSIISQYLSFTEDVKEIHNKIAVSVYPNPADERIYFKTPEVPLEASIYDLTGRERKRTFFNSGSGVDTHFIDINDLEGGIYIYKLKGNKGIETGTFLIQ